MSTKMKSLLLIFGVLVPIAGAGICIWSLTIDPSEAKRMYRIALVGVNIALATINSIMLSRSTD